MKSSEREEVFSYILRLTGLLQNECKELCELIDAIEDAEVVSRRVSILEEDGDELNHQLYYYYRENMLSADKEAGLLNKLFGSIEECVDQVEEVSKCFLRYNVTEMRESAIAGFTNSVRASAKMEELMLALKNMNKVNTPFKDIIELDHFKIENRKLYDSSMRKLFSDETNPIEILRWKEIYDAFMLLFDCFEKVSEAASLYAVSIY